MARKRKTLNHSASSPSRTDLRCRGEAQQRKHPAREKIEPAETRRLFHKLETSQIALEMQNTELRRVQLELEQSRAQYADLFDYAPVGYLILSTTGIVLEANVAAGNLMGLARSQLVKTPLTRFIVREDQDIYHLYRKRLFETRARQVCELRMMRKSGALLWVRIESIGLQGGDDALAFRAILSDVTESKRREETLRVVEANYRGMFENAVEGIYHRSPQGRFTRVNPAMARILGYASPHEVVKSIMNVRDHFYADHSRRATMMQQLEQKGTLNNYESECLRKDGTHIWISENTRAVRDVNGTLSHYEGFIQDITARLRSAEVQRQSEPNHRALVESSSDHIRMLSRDGTYLTSNNRGGDNSDLKAVNRW